MRIISGRGFATMLANERRYAKPLRAALTALLMVVVLAGATVVAYVGLAVTAFAYDVSWYKTNGWSGEYPNGFTITNDMTINIRAMPDPEAPKSIPCLLRKGATFHEWNKRRVISDRLEFVSFTKIETYELNNAFITKVFRQSDGREVVIKFKKGDRWSYLSYGAERNFVMKFADESYVASEELFQNSTEMAAATSSDQSKYDEWLKLTCANGSVGWIFFNEIKDAPGFSNANIVKYGVAADTLIQMKRKGGTYVVPVSVNDAITLDFIVDSGATDVSIPADVVLTLIRTGTLKNSDFIGTRTYRLADGSTAPSTTFRIRSLKVGGQKVENVIGSVTLVRGTLLLGQSFLSHFKSWSIDNNTHTLRLDE